MAFSCIDSLGMLGLVSHHLMVLFVGFGHGDVIVGFPEALQR
jgi:hypothetical protein